MKTAVPGTRVALFAADFTNTGIGIALSAISCCISCGCATHVVSMAKIVRPIASGTQPPSGTLIRLALK